MGRVKVFQLLVAVGMILSLTKPFAWAEGSNAFPDLKGAQSLTAGANADSINKDPLQVQKILLNPSSWSAGQSGNIEIQFFLPTQFHAYKEQFKLEVIEPEGFKVSTPEVSPIQTFFDKSSGKDRLGVNGSARLKAYLEAPAQLPGQQNKLRLRLTYQACSQAFCLFPTKKILDADFVVQSDKPEMKSAASAQADSPNGSNASVNSHLGRSAGTSLSERFETLLSTNRFLALIIVFFAGVLTSFTPCIFPMIPITLAVIGKDAEKRSRLQNFLLSLSYVVGIASTYSILGLVVASSGALFGAALGNPIVLSIVCIVFLTMSLSMYGLFDLQVPAGLRNAFGNSKQSQSFLGAYVTGLVAGIVASPCVGPVLVSILAFVATTKSLLYGFLLLFTYAMGLGLIFLLLGAFTELTRKLPRSGPWMEGTKFVLGSLMLGAFFYYLDLLLPQRFFDLSLGAGLIILASAFGAFEKVTGHHQWRFVRKGLMQAVLFIGFGYVLLGVFDLRPSLYQRVINPDGVSSLKQLDWQPYSESAFQAAITSGKPVILDFWAEWCAACHELEQFTFSDPRIRQISNEFILLKFDATEDSEKLRLLKQKYKIQGLPTVLFFNNKGTWIDSMTLTEFEDAEHFAVRMKMLLK